MGRLISDSRSEKGTNMDTIRLNVGRVSESELKDYIGMLLKKLGTTEQMKCQNCVESWCGSENIEKKNRLISAICYSKYQEECH